MRYLIPAGGTAIFLFLAMTILLVSPPPAAAQEPEPPQESFLEMVFVSGGYYTYPALLMLAAIVVVTVTGSRAAKGPQPWPLWPNLARGLGDAGFLFAIIATFASLREAMATLARVGAAATTADVAFGLAQSLTDLVVGAFVALAGVVAAGLLRWRRARLLAGASRDALDAFA